MRVVVGADHAGFDLKEKLTTYLHELRYQVVDVGTYTPDPADYPDYAEAVGLAVRSGQADRGIIICGSGVGTSIAVNKIPGIRAGLCHDTYSAHQGVEHDDMNVLVLGARVIGVELARELVRAFLGAVFSNEGRHCRRLEKVKALERRYTNPRLNRQTYSLPSHLAAAVAASLEEWRISNKVQRLWARDASLWTDADEGNWLGWLDIVAQQHTHREHLHAIAEEVRAAGFSHVLLLGMGGSSLCPEVLTKTFGKQPGFPELHVLDSTDPAQVKTCERKVDLANTLFVVSSKSGTTLEPNLFMQYFFERVKQVVGAATAGSRFIAITDPGSKLQQIAEQEGFRRIFHGEPSIGGRYSALSDFGLVPAAIMGVDVLRFLNAAGEMVQQCTARVPIQDNPGVELGTILGVLAQRGRDKVTLITSPAIQDLGAWLEQLLAESTGKNGKGLIPVDQEPLGPPEVHGNDRLFVYVRLESAPDAAQDMAVTALEQAGQPVVRIPIVDPYQLGAEFFRWEIAAAVAGAIIGVNPFDQPDVEASKVVTRTLTVEYEKAGTLPAETPILVDNGLKLFTDERNATTLAAAVGSSTTLTGYLKAHLNRLRPGDYFCIAAYLEMNEAHHVPLQALRQAVRDAKKVATCLGYGPRFLHSTGQAYKGGPNTGVFLQLTCDDAEDLLVPGQRYTFGVVKAAQARGDFAVLVERGRRALRLHLGKDVQTGLTVLRAAVEQALR
jgi:ribose 5-phosphate isomerase B